MVVICITRTADQYQKTFNYIDSHLSDNAVYYIIPPCGINTVLQNSKIKSVAIDELGLHETLYEIFSSFNENEKIVIVPETRVPTSDFIQKALNSDHDEFFYEEVNGLYGGWFKNGTFFPCGDKELDWININSLSIIKTKINFLSWFPRISINKKKAAVPRILVFGVENLELKSIPREGSFESDELEVFSYLTSENASKIIAELDPDCIITVGESERLFMEIFYQPSWIRLRWMHVNEILPNLGEEAYLKAMDAMISGKKEYPLISIITPIRNIGEMLWQTYKSVSDQTWWNWEWILINDGDDLLTDDIAKEISSLEPRVKYYNIYPRSNSKVGEAKYRGFSLSEGDYLVELDHDDMLTPEAIELVALAFEKYPDAGFCYSNYAEVDADFNDLSYGGDSFAYGYGLYSVFDYKGTLHSEQHTPHINPISIRSNVAMPNHLRAWTRDTYFLAGAHCRRLSVMDDFELLIRTFLVSKMIKIDWMCYWQFYYTNTITNTQNLVRMDIQRRSRTISNFYNSMIKKRFNELGKIDWAFEQNPENPRDANPVFGEDENRVNYTLNREIIEQHLYNRNIITIYNNK